MYSSTITAPNIITIFVFIIITHLFPPPVTYCSLDEGYSHCSPYSFNCGDVVNVTYPFLAGNRSSLCGYPQMNLTCTNDSPELEIESVKYHLSNIRYPDRIFTAVNLEYLSTSCPRPSADTNIGNFSFELGNQSVPLNLLINCPTQDTRSNSSSPELLHQISCLSSYYRPNQSYYSFEANERVVNETFERERCERKVKVMVLRTELERLRNGSLSYEQVVRGGFDVKWRMGAGWCTDCVFSDGICGFNVLVPEQSVCYCHDQTRFAACPVPGQ